MEYMVPIQVPPEKVSLVVLIVHSEKLSQLDLYSNERNGSYTSPTGKGFSGRTYSPLRETFYSWTCIAVEYMVPIQVPLEIVSLVVLIVHPEKSFTVGRA